MGNMISLLNRVQPCCTFVSSRSIDPISIFFPVLVFDGVLHEAIVEKNDVDLVERNHILLERHFRPFCSLEPLTYKIDVVKKGYFPGLVEIINRDIEWICDQFRTRRETLKEEIADSVDIFAEER